MACQTVVTRFGSGMTIHTPIHCHFDPRSGWWSFALTDISMTFLTIHFGQYHMASMGKEDMIGLFVNPSPWNVFSFLKGFPYFFLFRILCDGIFVAFDTDGDLRHPGEGLGFEIAVASDTLCSLLKVFFVIKGDRLISLGDHTKTNHQEKENASDHQSDEEESHGPTFRFFGVYLYES